MRILMIYSSQVSGTGVVPVAALVQVQEEYVYL